MPLFSRRSRSVSVSRPTTPSATSPAMMAASQAFVAHQGSQTKLATGAAAAALRSMSPASTPVGQVQTRRMLERQNSANSPQNAQRGRSRGNNMVRRSSSASMSERTFREPSPGRPAQSNGASSTNLNQPPVPQLPDNYNNIPPIPPIPKKSSRRSLSIDETQLRMRQTPERQVPNRNSMIALPSPKTMPSPKPAINPAAAAAKRVASAHATPRLERDDSSNSVNFSYPGRARPSSPPPQTNQTTPTKQRVPSTPPGISNAEARRIQYEVARTAEQPVKKKKPQVAKELVQGSHLQAGTVNSKPTLTPLAPGPPAAEVGADAQALAGRGLNASKLSGQSSHFPPSPVSPASDVTASDSDSNTDRVKTRRAQRASGALQKQPSIVREDWEGEHGEDEEAGSPVTTAPARIAPTKRPNTEADVSRKIEEPAVASQSDADTTQTPASVALSAPQSKRGPSLSPSRSTRFSKRLSSDITEGQRHEPPPRSVSPMKPALKHSHSPQLRAVDGIRTRDSSEARSEATDLSADGNVRPKKTAHVKFDNQPSIVGISAEPGSPVSPQVASPQHAESSRRWFGGKPKPQPRAALQEDSDDEDAMGPRPQLPTFGSVRKGHSAAESSSTNPKVISSPSSSSSSSSLSLTRPTTTENSVSSDHAIGALLSSEGTKKGSTEGDAAANSGQAHPSFIPMPTSKLAAEGEDVPSIAVQPATPGTEAELKPSDQWLVEIPGGFPSATSTSAGNASNDPSSSFHDQVTSAHEGATLSDDSQYHHERMPSIEEEDEDRNSIYSDAAEDLSDLEGDGFGSINAIVRSPIVPSPGERSSVPDSPATPTPNRDILDAPESPSSWDDAGARWKTLADTAKQTALQPAAPIVEKSAPKPEKRVENVPPRSQARPVSTSSAGSPTNTRQKSAATSPTQSAQDSQPGSLRKSMRNDAGAGAPHTMRSSVRTSTEEAPRTMRTSVRNSGNAGAAAASAARPMSTNPPPRSQEPVPIKSNRSAPVPAQQPQPRPQSRLPPVNNDSDSESSFKKRRRNKASNDNKYTMRRSMRASDAPAPAQTASVQQRREVRSMSPFERRPFSAAGGQATMRTSMRSSMDEAPSLRNQNGGKRSSSLFGRSKPQSPTRPVTNGASKNNVKSRFADSDDEGDGRVKAFKSRFGDSSDEEEDLRPVRGIPKTSRRDDSTDLEDSSDDERRRGKVSQPISAAPVQRTAPPIPDIPERPSSPMSTDSRKRRGLFSRFRRSRDESNMPTLSTMPPQVNGKTAVEDKPAQSSNTAALGFKSDADKEAMIEQTRLKLEAAQERTTSPTRTPGKLQRRSTPQRIMSDSWPAPPKIPDTPDRPQTSSGAETTINARPDLGDRQPSSPMSNPESGMSLGKAGKKKRFPLLRKAFGLKD